MFVTITSITTIMRARMLHAVSPLLIWFWSAFPWLFCNFVFKSSVAASLMSDMMNDEWSQCQSAWECVDACMIVAMCATCVELWCMCVRIVMHANAWLLCLCLIGYVPSHLNICMLCIALLVKRCSWLWTYGDDGSCLRKFPEILFKQYFGSYSAFIEHPPSFFCKIIFPFVVLNVGCLFAFVMCLNNVFEFTGNDCN